jgi:hypothetical protein
MSKDKIHNAIRILSGMHSYDKVFMFDAIVNGSVNESTRTVNVTMLGGESSNDLDVRLMSSVDDGMFIYPKGGSTVTIIMSDKTDPYIVGYSEIEKIVWFGGEYGNVPIVKHPSDSNKGLTARLNKLEDFVKDLSNKYNSHTHTTTCAAGPGTATTTLQQETGVIINTTDSDISHPNIEH